MLTETASMPSALALVVQDRPDLELEDDDKHGQAAEQHTVAVQVLVELEFGEDKEERDHRADAADLRRPALCS